MLEKRVFLGILAGIIFALYCVSAATYYVSTNGDNSSAGSAESPWRNIQYAMNNVSSGDIIIVSAGMYNEKVTVKKDNIQLISSSQKPVINGTVTVSAKNGVTIRGFDIYPDITGSHAVQFVNGNGFSLSDSVIHAWNYTATSASCVYVRNSSDVQITDNEVYNCRKGINIVSARSAEGYDSGTLIKGNKIHDNPVDGIDLHGEYITVDGNTIFNNIDSDWASNHPDGIQIIASTVDGLSSVKHAIIKNNVIHDHTQNIFTEGTGTAQDPGCVDVSIYNNVLFNTPSIINGVNISAIAVKNIIIKKSRDVYVHHNTLGYSTNTGILVSDSYDGSVHIKNNIITNNLAGVSIENSADLNSGELDYNIYYLNRDDVKIGSTYYRNVSSLSSAGAQEVHGAQGNPLIADFPDVSLSSNSPAIDAGTALDLSFSMAKNGIVRPSGNGWDVGAYEYLFGNTDDISSNVSSNSSSNVSSSPEVDSTTGSSGDSSTGSSTGSSTVSSTNSGGGGGTSNTSLTNVTSGRTKKEQPAKDDTILNESSTQKVSGKSTAASKTIRSLIPRDKLFAFIIIVVLVLAVVAAGYKLSRVASLMRTQTPKEEGK